MIGKKIIESDPIPLSQVKDLLEERAQFHELGYEQNLAMDHVTKFSKLNTPKALEMIAELEEIVRLQQAIKIADIMPEDLADMRLLFAKERGSQKNEDLEKILEIVNKYRE